MFGGEKTHASVRTPFTTFSDNFENILGATSHLLLMMIDGFKSLCFDFKNVIWVSLKQILDVKV